MATGRKACRLLLAAALLLTAALPARGEEAGAAPAAMSLRNTELNNRGVQEAQAGRFEEAVKLLRQALSISPADLQVKKNLSGILTDWAAQLQEKGQLDQAMSALEEAHLHDPANAKALLLLGDLAYSTKDDLSAALLLWKKALPGVPSNHRQSLLDRISQAERDVAIEKGFQAVQTEHFQIRFEGQAEPEHLSQLSGVLEEWYGRLKANLGSGPSHVGVIVYAGDNFKRIAGRQDWTLGLYDGRIRLRLEDIGTGLMVPIIAHELAHAFLREKFGPRVPVWVHEGFAQAMEPARPLTPREEEVQQGIISRNSWVPLKWLDKRFQQPSHLEDVERAYAQSKWAVSRLLERFGIPKFRQFLGEVSAGKPMEKAFDQAFAPLAWGRADAGNFD